MRMKRELGKAMQELLSISLPIADILRDTSGGKSQKEAQ